MVNATFKKNIVHLTNGSISYYIYITDNKQLETLYFGKFLPEIKGLEARRFSPSNNGNTVFKNGVETYNTDAFDARLSLTEVGTHGIIDPRPSLVTIKNEKGESTTDFRFESLEIKDNLPDYPNDFPHAHGKGKTVTFILKNQYSKKGEEVLLQYNISILEDKDVIIKNVEVSKNGNLDAFLTKCLSLQLDIPRADLNLHHFSGKWGKERNEVVTELNEGIYEVSSNYGRSSHYENPFMFLSEKDANYEHGEVYGFNLIYSGNFLAKCYVDYFNTVRFSYGINDFDFEFVLNKNKCFISPQAILVYSDDGIDYMSQTFHRFIKENLITYKHENEYKSILYNSWEGVYMDFNTEKVMSMIDKAKNFGTELFVLDDGWFGHRDNDSSSLGDWFVNEKKIDLNKVSNHVHELGMKFGLWFEPEMISIDSELYKKHPEYVLGYPYVNLSSQRHQVLLDFSNPEVVDNIFNQMVAILDKYPIDYVKWDHNREIGEHISSYNNLCPGEVLHKNTLGYFSLLSRLTQKYPNIMFEGCASGGGRFDLGTLYYCPQIWCSDESDPAERLYIQFNTSLGYPLSTLGSHANNHKLMNYYNKAALALFGSYGFEFHPDILTETDINELRLVNDLYHKYHQNVIEDGILYHISSPANSNKMIMQSVSKDKANSLLIFINKRKEHQKYRIIKLKGLNPQYLYKNSLTNEVMSGLELMRKGLSFTDYFFDEFSLKLIEIEKI